MTGSIPRLENTPRQMVFLQECLTGPTVMGHMHCGSQMENGSLEERVILEVMGVIYIAPTLHSVLSLLDHTGNTGLMESGWMLKEMQSGITMKV